MNEFKVQVYMISKILESTGFYYFRIILDFIILVVWEYGVHDVCTLHFIKYSFFNDISNAIFKFVLPYTNSQIDFKNLVVYNFKNRLYTLSVYIVKSVICMKIMFKNFLTSVFENMYTRLYLCKELELQLYYS